jgi:hypothetical protein
MRLKHVNVRVLLSSVLAVLALSAVVASAAQASAEGPMFKMGGSRLLEGSSKEVTAKKIAGNGNVIISNEEGVTIQCTGEKLASGATLTGSTGANFSGGSATLEFTGCSAWEGSKVCELEGGKFKSEPLKLELAYQDVEPPRTGDLLVYMVPVNKKDEFVLLKFTNCSAERAMTGGLVAKVLNEKSEAVTVGHEAEQAKGDQLAIMEGTLPAKIELEKAGKLVVEKVEWANYIGGPLQFDGAYMQLELTGGSSWGVFT